MSAFTLHTACRAGVSQQQKKEAALAYADVSGNRSLRLKALQEKAALLHDPGQNGVPLRSKVVLPSLPIGSVTCCYEPVEVL
jgi:hypothetical protein